MGIHTQLKKWMKDSSQASFNYTTWKKAAVLSTKEETIATGCCYLAASAVFNLEKVFRNVDVKPVSSAAVAIRFTDKSQNDLSPIKIIFDYDRRVPAGPYKLNLTAAELVARKLCENPTDEKIQNEYTKKKYIQQREQAALNCCLQVYQQLERGGMWIPVGDVHMPLVKKVDKKKGEEGDFDYIACEESTLNLSLKESGMVNANVTGDFHSVVQASKNLRSSIFEYYVILIFCVLFFGGFLVKSFIEDYTFRRDVNILLHYYKIALPGSIYDGDVWKARYLCYKYRGRRHVLWKRLEKKYDIPVPLEWDEEEEISAEEPDDAEESTKSNDEDNAEEL